MLKVFNKDIGQEGKGKILKKMGKSLEGRVVKAIKLKKPWDPTVQNL